MDIISVDARWSVRLAQNQAFRPQPVYRGEGHRSGVTALKANNFSFHARAIGAEQPQSVTYGKEPSDASNFHSETGQPTEFAMEPPRRKSANQRRP